MALATMAIRRSDTNATSEPSGILPTGTGKSVCYQIPALSRFDKTGALTVVISPLVALMADQVQGLARAGISAAVTINGMLSLPERHDALEKVRMGTRNITTCSAATSGRWSCPNWCSKALRDPPALHQVAP